MRIKNYNIKKSRGYFCSNIYANYPVLLTTVQLFPHTSEKEWMYLLLDAKKVNMPMYDTGHPDSLQSFHLNN